MKYLLTALALVAAVGALFVRPPLGGAPAAPTTPAEVRVAATAPPQPRAGNVRNAPGRVVVYVAGEVAKPGVYRLAPGERAQDALARAGGPKPDADLVAVNLAAPVNDGEEIAVPKMGAEPARRPRAGRPRARAPHAPRGHARRRSAVPVSSTPQSVDLNAADERELATLPGIGPRLAARIVAFRETNGPFSSVDELADVSGITPHLQDELADVVFVR